MRKLCTRQHFIEYLSYNFVERQCLLARCLWLRHHFDYGIDGHVKAVNDDGEVGDIFKKIQVKATERLRARKGNGEFVYDFSKRDLETWLAASSEVLLVVYDAANERAFFVDLANYFGENRKSLAKVNKFARLYFPATNVFDSTALLKLKHT